MPHVNMHSKREKQMEEARAKNRNNPKMSSGQNIEYVSEIVTTEDTMVENYGKYCLKRRRVSRQERHC